jgi:hypothetical protein
MIFSTRKANKLLTISLIACILALALWLALSEAVVLPVLAAEQTYYVDNTASGNNDGTSWGDAWESFSDIDWNIILPGDTIYISGGTTSQTYDEVLRIRASGDETGYITIQVGQDPGHNGTVVITGAEHWGVLFDGSTQSVDDQCHYVILSGQVGDESEPRIRVSNPIGSGVYLSRNVNHIIIEYVEMSHNGDTIDAHHGLRTNSVTTPLEGEIRHCVFHDNLADDIHMSGAYPPATRFGQFAIHHNEFYNYNDDCIEIALGGVDIYSNVFHDRRAIQSGHPDNIQAYGDYYRVFDNFFYNMLRTGEAGGNANLYFHPTLERAGSHCSHLYAYNNVFYEDRTPAPNAGTEAVQMGFGYDITSLSDVIFVNNTIVGPWGLGVAINFADLQPDDVENVVIENNIFSDCERRSNGYFVALGFSDTSLSFGPHGSGADVIIDYNSYSDSLGRSSYIYNAHTTYDAFRTSTGCQEHGTTALPDLAPDFRPAGDDSPVVEAGVSFSQYFAVDKAGHTRPQGAGWDIGAYEFVPDVYLHGTSGDQTIYLDWIVNVTLPPTATWHIDYYTTTLTTPFTATDSLSTTRSYVLTENVENYQWYTVTLYAMLDELGWLSDTVRVMPTNNFVYLPVVLK